jgi:integrase
MLGDDQTQKLGLSRCHLAQMTAQLDAEWSASVASGHVASAWRTAAFATSLLVGFYGMLRASELLSLRWSDLSVDWTANGGAGCMWVRVRVRRSKVDQFGRGRSTTISLANPHLNTALAFWWARYLYAPFLSGPAADALTAADSFMLRLDAASADVGCDYLQWLTFLRTRITMLGLDARKYGTHSLRRGGATAAIAAGVPLTSVMAMAGWKSFSSAMLYTTADEEVLIMASSRVCDALAESAESCR